MALWELYESKVGGDWRVKSTTSAYLKCPSIHSRAISWPNSKACSLVKNVFFVVNAVGGSEDLLSISTMGVNEAGEPNAVVIVTTHSLYVHFTELSPVG